MGQLFDIVESTGKGEVSPLEVLIVKDAETWGNDYISERLKAEEVALKLLRDAAIAKQRQVEYLRCIINRRINESNLQGSAVLEDNILPISPRTTQTFAIDDDEEGEGEDGDGGGGGGQRHVGGNRDGEGNHLDGSIKSDGDFEERLLDSIGVAKCGRCGAKLPLDLEAIDAHIVQCELARPSANRTSSSAPSSTIALNSIRDFLAEVYSRNDKKTSDSSSSRKNSSSSSSSSSPGPSIFGDRFRFDETPGPAKKDKDKDKDKKKKGNNKERHFIDWLKRFHAEFYEGDFEMERDILADRYRQTWLSELTAAQTAYDATGPPRKK